MASNIEEQMALKLKQRERYFLRIQQCYDCIAGGEAKKADFLARLKDIDSTYLKYENVMDAVNELNLVLPEETTKIDTSKWASSSDALYYKIKAYEASLKEHDPPSQIPSNASGPSPFQPNPAASRIKLPVLSIPTFEGDSSTFQTWKCLYDQLIHSSAELSDIEKFSYLKSILKGPALACVDHVGFVSANYPLAYRNLVERYYNKRLIAGSHLHKILNFQPLKTESLVGLRSFLDVVNISVESLKGLKVRDLSDFILLYLGLNVLDSNTKRLFETENLLVDFPSFDQLVTFVKGRCTVLEATSGSCYMDNVSIHSKPQFKKSFVTVQSDQVTKKPINSVLQAKSNVQGSGKNQCPLCNQHFHKISTCPTFLKCDTSKRFSIIKDQKLCFSCFSAHHSSSECTSTYKCRVCNSTRHHSLLHPSESKKSSSQVENVGSTSGNSNSHSNVLSGVAQATQSVLLGTATVQIQDSIGQWHSARCIIDPGSQISAVSESLVQNLGLPRNKCMLQISGIGSQTPIRAKGEIQCVVLPHNGVCSGDVKALNIRAAVLPKIATDISHSVPAQVLEKFRHIKLADETYYLSGGEKVSSSIDLLLGAEYYADIMVSSFPAIPGSPSAIPSYFGWLLMGRVGELNTLNSKVTSLFISSVSEPLESQLQKFWELEGVSEVKPTDPNDVFCEEHFRVTHSRDPTTGKYIVRLPFKDNEPPQLQSNRAIAIKRFQNLQSKLDRNTKMKTLYCENLDSYLEAGHMARAENPSSYLLVHFAVYKESSSTPLRVVFDPNVAVSKHQSLSSVLMVGPKLQSNISDLLIQFRLNAVAVLCDVKSMYRCIWLAKEDCKYQHILWQDVDGKMQEYELKTVTFGLPPSPFLAQRVIKQLVEDEGGDFPTAAHVLNTSVYVDDMVSGADSIPAACALKEELTSLMARGGFQLRKWASSHSEVLADLPADQCETIHSLGDTDTLKVLGVQWSPNSDSFFFHVKPGDMSKLTKRKVLSIIASVYDPNGFISPVTIWLKIFMQQIWLNKDISWDTELPTHLQEKWKRFMSEISLIENIHIPRYVLGKNVTSIDLIGLADGSSVAYSAVVYLRVVDTEGNVQTHLIRSKTKCVPLQPLLTINKIELCSALLLSRVIKSLSFLLDKLNISNIYLFSDSTTVLSWLTVQPHLLKTFVANRVVEILELTKRSSWRHVSSQDNSADPASRGILPSELVNNALWFEGPRFLKKNVEEWPQCAFLPQDIPELKSKETQVSLTTQVQTQNVILSTIEKFSSLGKLQRVLAYALRFIHNVRFPQLKRNGALTLREEQKSLEVCVRVSQTCYMSESLEAVTKGNQCNTNLRSLTPFINNSGLLAVGGRLTFAPLPESMKHPVLIPKKSHLAILLIRYYHVTTIHGGPQLVQSLIHRKFWIIGARSLIRYELNKCLSCIRFMAKPSQPYMADLPSSRFEQGRPFIHVAVDFGGPFLFKTGPRRNSPVDKCWLALFCCLSSKAVHLEVVSSCSANAFLATLDRFIGRRSLPSKIFCDNATNFRGAAAQLQEIHKVILSNKDEITRHLQPKCIQFQFSPPGAPNFNGLAEAGIKSVKSHLRHVLRDQQPLSLEEYFSLFIRVEAILNSRPLCALPSSPNDGVDYLTPGHFLVGGPLLARPELEVQDKVFTPARRWQLITHFSQCFWRRWSSDYLNSLTQRTKWTKKSDNIKIDDVVLLQCPNMSPQNWPLGRVSELLQGKDEQIRVVKVKTRSGELVRSVNKLVVLPISS